ncbi:hypothetical protein [Sphaerisporangium rhizosphaerae]|uniref:Restriction endonuclease type IV Mrr domain-containing protein n=1 Tax=Sphaerisporangium rhizosphaerae TaxID=2269375 RepID=A0ABW2NZ17_9ACTN
MRIGDVLRIGVDLERLPETVFHDLVLAILQNDDPGMLLMREVLLSQGLRPDFMSLEPRSMIIEVVKVTPQTLRRLRDVRGKLFRYRDAFQQEYPNHPPPILMLIVSSPLTLRYHDVMRESGIELRDGVWIQEKIKQFPDVEHFFSRAFVGPEREAKSDRGRDLVGVLASIECGRSEWSKYQRICADIFEYLFCPPLEAPIREIENETKVNRRDFVIPNYCSQGFFYFLRTHYQADYIVVDAKNYCGDVGKSEVLQLANYLSERGAGLFGIIVTRNGHDATAGIIRREQWMQHGKLILFITDTDLKQMIIAKRSGGEPNAVLRQKIEDFRLSI